MAQDSKHAELAFHQSSRCPSLAALTAALCIVAQAQNMPPATDRGLLPGTSYSVSDIENLNLANGTLSLQIPLAKLPPGPAGFSTGISLNYNSDIYDFSPTYEHWPIGGTTYNTVNTISQSLSGGGWQYGYEYSLLMETSGTDSTCTTNGFPYFFRLSALFPDGSKHVLYLKSALNSSQAPITTIDSSWDVFGYFHISPNGKYLCPTLPQGVTIAQGPATLVYFTQDNTFVRVEISLDANNNTTAFWMYFLDGRKVHGTCASAGCNDADALYDKNGNKITVQTSHNGDIWTPVVTITDPLGRTISIGNNFATNPTQPTDTITAAGFGGALAWTVNWTGFTSGNPDSHGNQYIYQCVQNPGSGVSGNCGYGTQVPFNPGVFAISSITLPSALGTAPGSSRQAGDGVLQYTFGYSINPGWGELNQVATPLGETAHYTYTGDSNFFRNGLGTAQAPNPITAKCLTYKDPSGATRTRQWTYSGYFNVAGMTVTNPDGSSTVHGFGSASPNVFLPIPVHEQQPNNIIIDRLYTGACALPNYSNLGNFFVSAELHTLVVCVKQNADYQECAGHA